MMMNLTEDEIKLFIIFTKLRGKLSEANLEESIVCLVEKFNSELNVIDESLPFVSI